MRNKSIKKKLIICVSLFLCLLSIIFILYWLLVPYRSSITIKDLYWTSTIEIRKESNEKSLRRNIFCNGDKEKFPHYGNVEIDKETEEEIDRYINYYILDTNDHSYKCSGQVYFSHTIGDTIWYTRIRLGNQIIFDE